MKVVKFRIRLQLTEPFNMARRLTVMFSIIVTTMSDRKVMFAQLAANILTCFLVCQDMWHIPMVTETPTWKTFVSKVQSLSF